MGERTGSRVLQWVWSYVLKIMIEPIHQGSSLVTHLAFMWMRTALRMDSFRNLISYPAYQPQTFPIQGQHCFRRVGGKVSVKEKSFASSK
ncbi:hypothetical protein CCHR01_13255 [Colletotrichum chrysophilum]|uniref:Uncharacterized protein n=1 Tax=Colletotrichum chrysophilum TaxID=1836956 RepID=A0AAD9A9Q0_9PEZI|nr:hypothetical protein CCHR01_13255 [Colletotrichum chrysophilum]